MKEDKKITMEDIKKVKEALGEKFITEIHFLENESLPDHVAIVSSHLFKQVKKITLKDL